ncbi:MAG: archease [Deltaproteobacteria bacterium]|nr:archease [Deltaproteobacteria bacterium]
MPFEILADAPTSDVGFSASGATLDECFRAAAEATTSVMVGDLASVRPQLRRETVIERDALDMLLVAFLDEIVFYKDAESLFLLPQSVKVSQFEGGWKVEAHWVGEPIDPQFHMLSGDVKAVTLHRLRVWESDNGWHATVVLDV